MDAQLREPAEIACTTPGVVVALERRRKSTRNKQPVVERVYRCANGLALGARRGGPLHLADDDTWEIFTLCGETAYGGTVGWVTDEQLTAAVQRLAAWAPDGTHDDDAEDD